jgi:ArsR family transcriptional regulator
MEWEDIFKVFSDTTRLRILNMLSQAELNVNELMESMDLQQSRVSKHLKILKEQELVQERREGTWRFYSLGEKTMDTPIRELLGQVWKEEIYQKDRKKIKYILEKRKLFAEDFFLTSQQTKLGLGNFYSQKDLLMAFSMLIPAGSRVLDGGCGEGELLWYLSHNREIQIFGIDIYQHHLQKVLSGDIPTDNLTLQKSDITETPFENNFFDIVFTNMVLHHIPDPRDAFGEINRILKPGGKWIVIDFYKHHQERMRGIYKDFWLGFSLEELENFARHTSFELKNHYLIPQPQTEGRGMPDNLMLYFQKN